MMNEETKASLNRFLKQREERIKNMTLAEARDIISSAYGHSDMRMESNKALQMLLDCADKALEQKPREDCISRQAVLAYAKDTCLDLDKYEDTEIFCDEIKALPTVTPQPKKGKWIDVSPISYICSCCSYGVGRWNNTSYCPNCGALMEVEDA